MQEEESYIDDVNGGFLDSDLVKDARLDELAGNHGGCGSHHVIKARWCDTIKGDERSPDVLYRLRWASADGNGWRWLLVAVRDEQEQWQHRLNHVVSVTVCTCLSTTEIASVTV